MTETVYFDTSALAKWYLNEEKSQDVEQYIQEHGPVGISDLTVIEMRCLLARRRREGSIDLKMESRIFATFQEDIRQNFLVCHPFPEGFTAAAVNLISVHLELPLRTLDALHLVIAREMQADKLATADRVMIVAAKAMGLPVVRFDSR